MSSVFAVDPVYRPRQRASSRFPAEWVRYPQIPGTFGLSSAGRFLGATLLRRVQRLHLNFPVHLIHAHGALPCGHAAAYLSRRLAIPFVVTIHGLDVFNRCFQQGIASTWRYSASQKVYQNAQRVVCVSEKVLNALTAGMGTDVAAEVVYNGVDPALFEPGPRQGSRQIVLVVGNLLAIKGHELVLRALVPLQHSHPDLQCHIIGEGPEEKRLATLAAELGIRDRVHFLGRKSRFEVAAAMREATVFVLPSRYEGLGCVYLEAMASGKPVIACNGQGIDEVIAHGVNGWLVPVEGGPLLEQGLRALMDNPELRARIGHNARRTILDKLTLRCQADKLLRIYEGAMQ